MTHYRRYTHHFEPLEPRGSRPSAGNELELLIGRVTLRWSAAEEAKQLGVSRATASGD